MPLPAIAAALARIAVPVGRAIMAAGPAAARGIGSAASTIGSGAMDAGSAFIGSFRAAPAITRSMLGLPQQPMAAAARAAQSQAPQAIRQTINLNAPSPSGFAGVVDLARGWGRQGGNAGGGRSWMLPHVGQRHPNTPSMWTNTGATTFVPQPAASATAATQANQQASLANRAAAAQQNQSRWMQRGAELYRQTQHNRTRDQQRDRVEMNREFGAGVAAMRNYDPQAFNHFLKAAGIGLKGLASVLGGAVGVTAFFALLPKMIRDFGNSLLEARRPLADFNGAIAVAFARLDLQRTGRNITFARQVSGSTTELSRATSSLEAKLTPYAAAAVNLLQIIATVGIKRLEDAIRLFELINPAIVGIRDLLAKQQMEKDRKAASSLAELGLGIRDGKPFPERVKRPLK